MKESITSITKDKGIRLKRDPNIIKTDILSLVTCSDEFICYIYRCCCQLYSQCICQSLLQCSEYPVYWPKHSAACQ
ncbi:unnamed protein product [Moneuplotes crassus]|uniref:Uncharacterized protein n=1 Tax=Euplotes crassus TaxID=5936 RepID=A0AAD1X790_EUPCR|nr:unnamed protein product [Moneuplotes crassus]